MARIIETRYLDIETIRPYPANPRNGDTERIVESLAAHDQYRAIVVQASTGLILAGNHTYAALMETGAKQVYAHVLECDDDEAAKIVLVDNRTNDVARYDNGLLLELLNSVSDDLSGTGYDKQDVDRLIAEMEAQFDPVDEESQPRLDERASVECPECHAVFVPKK